MFGATRRWSLAHCEGRRDASLRECAVLPLESEIAHREAPRMRKSAGIARFPFARTLEGFDVAERPSFDAGRIRGLATCRWMADDDALPALGPPGVGETHLAVGPGREAARLGHSAPFAQIAVMIAMPARAQADGRLSDRLAHHAEPKSPILDERGL